MSQTVTMTKVTFLFPSRAVPTWPLGPLGGRTARREWKRIAPRLRAMGPLEEITTRGLALYCVCYAEFMKAARELQNATAESVKFWTLRTKENKIDTRRAALDYGFRLDARGRMDLTRPLDLDRVAARQAKKRAAAEEALLAAGRKANLPAWLAPPFLLNKREIREWIRTAPALLAKGRLRTEKDRDQLVQYCEAFADLLSITGLLRGLRRFKNAGGPVEERDFVDTILKIARYRRRLLKAAHALGSFVHGSNLSIDTIALKKAGSR